MNAGFLPTKITQIRNRLRNDITREKNVDRRRGYELT